MNSRSPFHSTACRRGLSMLEVIVSLILVATMMLVALTASANIMRNRTMSQGASEGQWLAGVFLNEISTLDYRENSVEAVFGPEPGESAADRTSYDDMDDFHGFRQVAPTFRDGKKIPGYGDWKVDIGVISLALSGSGFRVATDATSQFRLISVTVTRPDASMHTYRTIASITSTARRDSDSFERVRRVQVQFSDERELNVVVPLRNTPYPAY